MWSPSIVETLIKLGANLNLKDNSGRTALEIAMNEQHNEIVETLLRAGAFYHPKKNIRFEKEVK